MQDNTVYVVMGVSGSGKTTVGQLLAERLGLPFHDADDFHSAANIAKMRGGTPLTDEDRKGWLDELAASVREWSKADGAVLACSALKEKYRQQFNQAATHPIQWVFLDGSEVLLSERLRARTGHYMTQQMLASQLNTLEPPMYGLRLQLAQDLTPQDLVNQIVAASSAKQPA
ncbi:gluconokinase [Hymenobacter wooponensis]|uniref:Gluconokinase n=1 Tax=Hymenobacter wooponensis TaxID=1525360 RepID=A0A4Z0MSL1_9BACT|nr:gluconokinase [Hymenobacter wooponensis]TGD82429.1 gluconokinase [Hymenobacter wooponensis]